MNKFNITDNELQELRAAHKSAKTAGNAHAAYRINAIILLGNEWTLEEVSEALLLDTETLRTYANKFKSGGIPDLLNTKYTGGISRLLESEIDILQNELDSHVHLTTKSICTFVKEKFNIDYAVSGMTDLLHRLDYVYKKPKLVPANPDEAAQDIFIEQYLDFMENKPDDVEVFFADAVHPAHNSMPSYGWIKKGKIKELQSNTGRSRLNIHGAMNAETFETATVITEGSINTDTTIDLLQYLEQLYPLATLIYVILDNARYHYSPPVREYLQNSRIRLVFLPAYSPELNLIERLWRVFKKNVLYNKFYEKFGEFKKACEHFFKNQSKFHDEIASIMGDGLESLT